MRLKSNKIEKNKKKDFFTPQKIILMFTFLLIVLSCIIFLFFKTSTEAPSINTIRTKNGQIVFEYQEKNASINLIKAYPIEDAIGIKMNNQGEYFDFSINGAVASGKLDYKIILTKLGDSKIDNKYIKVYLTQINHDGEKTLLEPSLLSNLKQYSNNNQWIVFDKTISSNIDTNYRFRMWIDQDAVLYDNTGSNPIDLSDEKLEIRIDVKANQI